VFTSCYGNQFAAGVPGLTPPPLLTKEFSMSFPFDSDRPVRVAIAYTSGQGHTAKVAEHVAAGARSVTNTEVSVFDVASFDDHTWADLAEADAIVFGAPTYMGGPDGQFKVFADASASVWYLQGWKDKLAAGFTNSGHMAGDKLNTLVYFAILAAQHGMHWVSYGAKGGWDTSQGSAEDLNRIGSWLGVATQSNKDQPAELVPPASDLLTAEALGRRVAVVTRQWLVGRDVLAEAEALAAD
jgi:multimeric flavodoxin WrbA